MENSARVWIAALRGSQQRLASLVGTLSPEQLRGPSYDTEWSIAQVLSHLGSQAEIGQISLDRTLSGGEPLTQEDFQRIWAVWDARDPDEQAARSLAEDARQVASLDQLSDEQLDGIHTQMFGRESDAAALLALRLGEHAVHTWDVVVSFDPAATIAADCVALLVDRIAMTAGWTAKFTGEHALVHIRTTDPDREFLLEVADPVSLTAVTSGPGGSGQAAQADQASARQASRIEMPAEALLRLVYGRLDPDHTPPVKMISGHVGLDLLRRTFPGF
jgi:uncharacterized protein (TIGR03083 family)